MCVNVAVEINVLDYNVTVRQRTATYGAVRSVNGIGDNSRVTALHCSKAYGKS